MILADVPEWAQTLRDSAIAVAAVAGAMLTIAAAAKLPIVSRPIRALWRSLVGDPVGDWLGRVLDHHAEPDRVVTRDLLQRMKAVEHEVHTNDGQSLRDVADRVEVLAQQLVDRPPPLTMAEVRDGTSDQARS